MPALVSVLPANGKDVKCIHQVEVEFEITRMGNSFIINVNGPTGYESCDLVKLLQNTEPGAKWIACMGNDTYRRMEIRIDNIRHCVREYAVIYKFEVL
jgi:hypothetical protein